MSTKSSEALLEWKEDHSLHIYREMMDDRFYIEDEDGRVCLPKEIALKFAEILNSERVENGRKNNKEIQGQK